MKPVLARLPLVHRLAHGIARRIPFHLRVQDLVGDLVGAGTIALLQIAKRKPGGQGDSFEHYVAKRLTGAMLDELRHQDPVGRTVRRSLEARERAGGVGAPRFVLLDDARLEDAADRLWCRAPVEIGAELGILLSRLSERDRQIVVAFDLHGTPLGTLAKKHGISAPRISQLRTRALAQLRALVTSLP